MTTGPTVRRRRLGIELRKLRESNGYKLEEVAAQLGVASSSLSRIETVKAPTKSSYLNEMLAKPFEAFTFSPVGASVYQLGSFGTARKELRALDLKP